MDGMVKNGNNRYIFDQTMEGRETPYSLSTHLSVDADTWTIHLHSTV